ncbi:ABC transporter ATP-binding protein [Frankia tisae]|uniref:ABC transporter ATP-binding protein n=1 Tax=Frankia tisae TaxID=2950104 RepID=UPI0021BF2DA8|nr:ABC transporter ATP-binding protein [Frankia tisae]
MTTPAGTTPAGTTPAPAQPAVVMRDVGKAFAARRILDDFALTIARGEFVALLGRSGSGKTTLLRILAELDTVDEGTVLAPRNRSVVFQEPRLIPSERVWRNVLLGLPRRESTLARAQEALAEVNLADHARSWPHTLSGGEAQRVALVHRPDLLLLDEPFAALDALTRLRTQALVHELWHRHRPAVLLVTHDVDEALRLADRVVVLTDGKVGLDLRVDLARPREGTGSRFDDLRSQLLAELGVARPSSPA